MSVKLQSALVPPAMTTTQRDAIPAGRRPPGSVVFNTTTKRNEVNIGTDAAPVWQPNDGHFAGIAPGKLLPSTEGPTAYFSTFPFVITLNAAGTLLAQFDVTPTVDCWWTLHASMLCNTNVAAWCRFQTRLDLTDWSNTAKTDAIGQSQLICGCMLHSGAADYNFITNVAEWALVAGQQYRGRWVIDGINPVQTVSYYRNPVYTSFHNLGARPRY